MKSINFDSVLLNKVLYKCPHKQRCYLLLLLLLAVIIKYNINQDQRILLLTEPPIKMNPIEPRVEIIFKNT